MKQAAIDDGKPVDDRQRMNDANDRGGRRHMAIDCLKRARKDVEQEQDTLFANGLRDRFKAHRHGA